MGKTAGQSRIHHEEFLHLVLITGCYHDKLATVVLHSLHQRIDGFLTILVSTVAERVSLVNKQDAAHRLVAHIVDNLRCLTHVLTDECGTAGLQHTRRRQNLHRLEYLTHLPGYGCLTRSRITRQDEVHGQLLYPTGTHRGTLLHKHTLYSQTTDRVLHRTHADELIQFVKHLIQRTGSLILGHRQVVLRQLIHIGLLEAGIAHQLNKSLTLTLNRCIKNTAGFTGIAQILVTTQIKLLELPVDS